MAAANGTERFIILFAHYGENGHYPLGSSICLILTTLLPFVLKLHPILSVIVIGVIASYYFNMCFAYLLKLLCTN